MRLFFFFVLFCFSTKQGNKWLGIPDVLLPKRFNTCAYVIHDAKSKCSYLTHMCAFNVPSVDEHIFFFFWYIHTYYVLYTQDIHYTSILYIHVYALINIAHSWNEPSCTLTTHTRKHTWVSHLSQNEAFANSLLLLFLFQVCQIRYCC